MAVPTSRTDAHTYIGVQLGIAVLLPQ